jgi:hypothetical protein
LEVFGLTPGHFSDVQAVFISLLVNAMGSGNGGAALVSGATVGFLLWLGLLRLPR